MKWVVAGDLEVRERLARLLKRAGHDVATCSAFDHALSAVNAGCDGLLLAPGDAWTAAMEWLHETALPTRVPTVLVAPRCEAQLVLDAIIAGARSVVLEMDAPEKILVAIESALESEPLPAR
jgi:DNA-binding NarL/FixJ family response regulator